MIQLEIRELRKSRIIFFWTWDHILAEAVYILRFDKVWIKLFSMKQLSKSRAVATVLGEGPFLHSDQLYYAWTLT